MNNYNRAKKSDKSLNTFKKYGKYTQKSIRIMDEMKRKQTFKKVEAKIEKLPETLGKCKKQTKQKYIIRNK